MNTELSLKAVNGVYLLIALTRLQVDTAERCTGIIVKAVDPEKVILFGNHATWRWVEHRYTEGGISIIRGERRLYEISQAGLRAAIRQAELLKLKRTSNAITAQD